MKVLCIDNKPRTNEGPVNENGISEILNENEVYTVSHKFERCRRWDGKVLNIPCYTLVEFGSQWGFAFDRFVPLSDINEILNTELQKIEI